MKKNWIPASRHEFLVTFTRYFIPPEFRDDPGRGRMFTSDREEEILSLSLVKNFEENSEEEGTFNTHAGPESYESFVNQTKDEEMEFVVRSLAETCELGEFIKRREPHGHHKLCRLLDALLYLVARGNLVYDIELRCWVFSKPVNAPPTQEMRQRIMGRIRVSRDLQFETLRKATNTELPKPQREPTIQ